MSGRGEAVDPLAHGAGYWAAQPRAARERAFRALAAPRVAATEHDWRFWARANQMPPPGDWRLWLMLAGRGFGKTRAGAEWVRSIAERDGRAIIALVGATLGEARAVMVEGESGLLAIAPPGRRPLWEPSLKRLTWPSGARALLYSAAEPESLRGPQHGYAWADEIAKWDGGEAAWDNLAMTMRLGERPQVVATTTPRAVPLVRRLIAAPGTIVTHGRTTDNRANLAPGYLQAMAEEYGGTALGRQELDGELIEEVAGALWTRAAIEQARVATAPELVRVVIAVDPPAGEQGDACGIVAAGRDAEGVAHVLEDASVSGLSPAGWARAVAEVYARHRADRVVAEANNGGSMVEAVLRAADHALPVKLVHATRGKVARAEPVAALYTRGRVRHVGCFPALEDELCALTTSGFVGAGRSPDRADALVWALTELMLGAEARPGVRVL